MTKTDSTDRISKSEKERIATLESNLKTIRRELDRGDDTMINHTKAIQDLTVTIARMEQKTNLSMWLLAICLLAYISQLFVKQNQPIEIKLVIPKASTLGTVNGDKVSTTYLTNKP